LILSANRQASLDGRCGVAGSPKEGVMSPSGPPGAEAENLRDTPERPLQERTRGRIPPPSGQVGATPVLVPGYAPSCDVKQLAIQAVLDVVGPEEHQVVMRIDVGPGEPTVEIRRDHGHAGIAEHRRATVPGRAG